MSDEPHVHLIDDDAPVRDAVAFLLASAGLPSRLYASADELLRKSGKGLRGCVVSDMRMPGMDGITLLGELRSRGILVPFIVMTGHADVAMAVEAMKRGALDFIEKPFQDQQLLGAVRAGIAADTARRERLSRVDGVRSRLASLTDRQRQVLDGLVSGKPNKAIAQDLKLSPRTVEIHRANLMAKMGVRALSELVGLVLDPAGEAAALRSGERA
ncbi:response regulator FixJ [Aurantimonas sp. Leaf443]|uniref:response regulator FixJ n=1 Tax=Aurantimonas sp. Leaf443 TaxID=1736378 RepID=UPI0006FBF219|nr:response regulator FixJ [Aurantimonas sp. Leaf443]KQT88171.1 two-component system response regulator [Aurantimonas sp. Leaf443]